MSTASQPKFLPASSLLRSPFIFEAETIFIAFVIFLIEPTDFILILSYFSLAAKFLCDTEAIIIGLNADFVNTDFANIFK